MYIAPSAPIAVFDVTPKDWWNVISLAIQGYGGVATAAGALASFIAAAVALFIANRDRKERADERTREKLELRDLLGSVLTPEFERLLFVLKQLYTDMWKVKADAVGVHWSSFVARISWLESQIEIPATATLLKDLQVLDQRSGKAYATMFGLVPSLIKATEQFRICPRQNAFWEVRYGVLEYAIGNFAMLIAEAHEIPSGDLRLGNLQSAIAEYRKAVDAGQSAWA